MTRLPWYPDNPSSLRTAACAAAVLALAIAALGPPAVADPSVPQRTSDGSAEEPFPHFESLRGNVEFWKRVFGEWDVDRVAIHDLAYPGVLYEVVALPGPIEESYTEAQRDWLEERRGLWEDRLRALERKIDRKEPLDDAEKAWALALAEQGGAGAYRDAHERVRSQRGIRSRFLHGLRVSHRYDRVFRAILRAEGLPEDLAYLPHVESGFRSDARSSVGASGMWQFTKGTGRQYLRINGAIDERLDPVAAARGAARYMRDAYDQLGSWPIALTSYNHGVGGMLRAKRLHGDYESIYRDYEGRTFGFASKNFYAEFLAAREIARDPSPWFPEGYAPLPELDLPDAELAQRTPPSRVALAYGIPVETLAELNPAWTERAVRHDLALPSGTRVWLPAGTAERAEADAPATRLVIAGLVDEQATHRVRRGETLTHIAAQYAMDLDDLCDLNGIDPRRPIHVGQPLTVRTGRMSGGAVLGTYTVQRGDTLSGIARAFDMTLDDLRALNGMAPTESRIRVGEALKVGGGGSSHVHVVRPGETLLRIAGHYGVELGDLLRANRLELRSTIFPGQSLTIP